MPSPDWLTALNTAIAANTKEDWKRYADLARKADISERSIERVLKSQGIEGTPR